MTKSKMVDAIHEKVGMSRKDITFVVENVFSEIKTRVLSGEDVKLSGFGIFEVKIRGRRVGRNPKTGETRVILPRTVLKFRPSRCFKNEVNGGI